METTSRMKDFFDIYYLSNVFNFDGGLLKDAVAETARHRGRELEEDVFARIEKFGESEFFQVQWSNFAPAEEIHLSFSDTLKRLSDFLEPIHAAILYGEEFRGQWKCEQKKWICLQ